MQSTAHSPTQTIVLATRNAGKIRELAQELAVHNMQVLGLEDFPHIEDIEETGTTFEENALLKARAVATMTGYIAIADDSGLEVDALGGAPGVYSARYGNDWDFLPHEDPKTHKDARNNRKLQHALQDIPEEQRQARFVSCMAACKPTGEHIIVRGTWEGHILTEPRGHNGFGYDPLFFDPTIGRCAAELTKDEKNSRSHRGQALRSLLAQWEVFCAAK